MARTSSVLLLLGASVMLAALVPVRAKDFSFHFYEHSPVSNEMAVFGPEDSNDEVGKGYIYTNEATKTAENFTEVYGSVSGLYFGQNVVTSHEIFTITFADIGSKGGRFADAQLHLRGLWDFESDGSDAPKQEIAIVGGSGGLRGAYGTAFYTRVKDDVWHVKGKFSIDDIALVPVVGK